MSDRKKSVSRGKEKSKDRKLDESENVFSNVEISPKTRAKQKEINNDQPKITTFASTSREDKPTNPSLATSHDIQTVLNKLEEIDQ